MSIWCICVELGDFDKKNPTIFLNINKNIVCINKIYHIDKIQGILIGSTSANIEELEKILSRIEEK